MSGILNGAARRSVLNLFRYTLSSSDSAVGGPWRAGSIGGSLGAQSLTAAPLEPGRAPNGTRGSAVAAAGSAEQTLAVRLKIQETRKKSLEGGGEKRIAAQHKKVRRAERSLVV